MESPWRRVSEDREHGAQALAASALRVLDRQLAGFERLTEEERVARLRRWARQIAAAQPAMGAFRRWAERLEHLAPGAGAPGFSARLRSEVRSGLKDLEGEAGRLARALRHRVPPGARILTVSRSASVGRLLSDLPRARRPDHVRVLESRPGGEGRAFARDLRASGVTASVVPDRRLAAAVRESEIVLVGADCVERHGTLVHKVGTRRLAEAARTAHVPFAVVAGASKWAEEAPRPRRLPARFDRTPRGLITEFWTEKGVLRGGRRQGH